MTNLFLDESLNHALRRAPTVRGFVWLCPRAESSSDHARHLVQRTEV